MMGTTTRQILAAMVLVSAGGCMGPASGGDDPFATSPTTASPSSSGDDTGADTESSGEAPDESSTTFDDPTVGPDDGSSSTGTPLPPFSCDAAPFESTNLGAVVLFDPADPHPGDTLNVIVKATNGTERGDAPPMDLEVTRADGVQTISPLTIQGGDALYYYAIGDVPQGDICLRGLIDGQSEIATRIEVTPRPPSPPAEGGVYKIIANHQWTCDEQPGNGNELHVWVRDENGQGIPDARVELGYVDSTDPSSIYNAESEGVPSEIVTGDDGHGMVFNYWPISDNGLMTFTVQMEGAASDIATEITTGWWESNNDCNYCGIPTVNVWGHWSYTIEFVRDPNATELCVVPNDHAGMGNECGVTHIHHDPNTPWCWPL